MLEKVSSNFKESLLGKELLPVPTTIRVLSIQLYTFLSIIITQTVSKGVASLGQIDNCRKYAFDRKILTTIIITALVFSTLYCYCSSLWG